MEDRKFPRKTAGLHGVPWASIVFETHGIFGRYSGDFRGKFHGCHRREAVEFSMDFRGVFHGTLWLSMAFLRTPWKFLGIPQNTVEIPWHYLEHRGNSAA